MLRLQVREKTGRMLSQCGSVLKTKHQHLPNKKTSPLPHPAHDKILRYSWYNQNITQTQASWAILEQPHLADHHPSIAGYLCKGFKVLRAHGPTQVSAGVSVYLSRSQDSLNFVHAKQALNVAPIHHQKGHSSNPDFQNCNHRNHALVLGDKDNVQVCSSCGLRLR